MREKERYQNPSIELVAEIDNKIVGLIDLEYEVEKGTLCYKNNEIGGVIWHMAVLPEYRNCVIATSLLNEAIKLLNNKNIKIVQAWTRDDQFVLEWYNKRGFMLQENESYLHIFAKDDECDLITDSKINKLYIYNCFSHYSGPDIDLIKQKFKRVHTCNLFEIKI